MISTYEKKLSELVTVLNAPLNADDVIITNLVSDSRLLQEGALFVATKGLQIDARDYVEAVTKSNAAALVYEANELSPEQQAAIELLAVPAIAVAGLSEQIGVLAAEFYGNPTAELGVFGITGTNGKTSCAYLLTQCLSGLGYKTGFMGTIGYGEVGNLSQSTHTTMDAINLQRTFAEMRDAGFTHVCMEVSSHALDQARVAGTEFYGVMLTNLTHDHLDYHGTMENYAAAKRQLFTRYSSKFAVVNEFDISKLIQKDSIATEYVVAYGDGINGEGADVRAEDVEAAAEGVSLYLDSDSVDFELNTPLIGRINVPNILLVASTLLVLGVDVEDIQAQLSTISAPPGRMELFAMSGAPSMVVDYAHTPDALDRALSSLREHCKGELWVVFGCGGDRDQAKRAMMGEIASNNADKVVITNDNPRSEQPSEIIGQILQGVSRKEAITVIENREHAIQWVVNHAKADDWVLVAGKGHEDYQIIGDETLVYSDRVWVTECLEAAA